MVCSMLDKTRFQRLCNQTQAKVFQSSRNTLVLNHRLAIFKCAQRHNMKPKIENTFQIILFQQDYQSTSFETHL